MAAPSAGAPVLTSVETSRGGSGVVWPRLQPRIPARKTLSAPREVRRTTLVEAQLPAFLSSLRSGVAPEVGYAGSAGVWSFVDSEFFRVWSLLGSDHLDFYSEFITH
jgi:hypothetical protein